MNKIAAFLLTLLAVSPIKAQLSDYDLNEPFGWCTCKSISTTGYTVNGASAASSSPSKIVLTSTGADQSSAILTAIKNYNIIVFDGTNGDFIFKNSISLSSLKNKTIVGINGARLCTQFYVTSEIKALLDKAEVSSASTSSGTGGQLSTGDYVSEQREYLTRKTLIEAGYSDSQVRKSGIFSMSGCSNIIIRNIAFVGPGPIDVGGYDLITQSSCTNMWVDHCSFTDGIDGNYDINNTSNLITVSWCTFAYTDRAYDHMNTNLIGGSDSDGKGSNVHNVTFANCMWGTKCKQRMPMARNGIIHILNDYYNCAGNDVAINPRYGSYFVVEGISVESGVKLYSQTNAYACSFSAGYYANGFDETSSSANFGTKPTIPYSYTVNDASKVADYVSKYAGPTLTDPLTFGRSTTAISTVEQPTVTDDKAYNLMGIPVNDSYKGIVIINGKKVFRN